MLGYQDNVVLTRPVSEIISDVVSCDVSGDTLVTGHRSGHIRVYTIHGQQTVTFTLVQELVTNDSGISVVSVTEDRICVGAVSGQVTLVSWRLGHWSSQCHNVGDHVTAATWTSRTTVCVGSVSGAVSLVHCVTGKPVTQILELGSKIVQIQSCSEGDLLVSSLTCSFLVNSKHKSFHQLGAKPRQGEFGACELEDTCHVAARPGCRLWKVDKKTGNVIETCQFKNLLEEQIPITAIPCAEVPDRLNHGFTVLKSFNDKIILTYNSKNIYLLDIEDSQVSAWWSVGPHNTIKEVHIAKERARSLIVLTSHGLILFSVGPLSSLLADIVQVEGEVETRSFLQKNVSYLELAKAYLLTLSKVENSCAITDLLQDMLHLEEMKSRSRESLESPEDQMSDPSSNTNKMSRSDPVLEQSNIPEKNGVPAASEETNVDEDSIEKFSPESSPQESESVQQHSLVKLILAAQNVLDTNADCDTKEISDFSLVLKEWLSVQLQERSSEHLTSSQREMMSNCFNKILMDQLYIELCFHPLKDIIEETEEIPEDVISSFAKKQLVVMFDQKSLDQDLLLSSIISYLLDILDHQLLINKLQIYHYFTFKTIIKNKDMHEPLMSPIPLDNVDETNVYDKVNLLSNMTTLSPLDVLRYAVHVSQFDTECSIHLLQNFTLELSPSCILYFALTYFEILEKAVKDRLSEDEELNEAINVEFQSVLVRCLSFHIPGWMEQYQNILINHPALATTMFEAYKTTNESRLSKTANLVGSHKSCEALDTAALGLFLMKHYEGQGMEPASFCLKTSDMVGLARVCSQNVGAAVDNLAILVELGDVELLSSCGLITANNVDRLVSHLVTVYPGHGDTMCPVSWSQLAHTCLTRVGPEKTRDILLTAARAKCIDRGSLGAQFYSKLIVQSLCNKS